MEAMITPNEFAQNIISSIDGSYNNYYVFFSGGKDSLCVLDLVVKNLKSDFKVIYIEVTGNTHPLCNDYAHSIVEDYYGLDLIHLKSENDNFFELLNQYGYPSCIWYQSRWCLNRFKNIPLRNYGKLRYAVTFLGMKIADSSNRKRYISETFPNGIKKNSSKPYIFWGVINVLPIIYFAKIDVWKYIKTNNLPLNPCYELIGSSGNCVICPYNTFTMMQKIKRNASSFYQKWLTTHENINKLRNTKGEKSCGIFHVFNKFNRYYYKLKSDLSKWET